MKGVGPLYDELHGLFAREYAPTRSTGSLAEVTRLLRERGALGQLIVTANFDQALERALTEAGEEFDVVSYIALGRHRGKFLHVSRGGRGQRRRGAQHLHAAVGARAADRDPEDPRRRGSGARARVGQLRRQRGRLHRLPRAVGSRRRDPGRPGRAAAPEPLPLPRLPAPRVVRPRLPAPPLGHERPDLPLVGGRRAAAPLELESWRSLGIDVFEDGIEEYVAELHRRIAAAGRRDAAPANPFKGLARFEDTDGRRALFFGRERDREIIVANLIASRLTVLYGESGVGKSSLLRAAVVRLRRALADAAGIEPTSRSRTLDGARP